MTVKPQLQKKIDTVAEIKINLGSQATVLADYRGINVASVTRLRASMREVGIKFKVSKNTLTKRAANELGISSLDSYLEGPTVLAFGNDPAALAKILTDFAKTNKNLVVKVGLLDGKLLTPDNIKTLADLPSREVLLSQVLTGMMAPLNGMVNVLQGPMRNFVQVLEAYRKQQAGEAS